MMAFGVENCSKTVCSNLSLVSPCRIHVNGDGLLLFHVATVRKVSVRVAWGVLSSPYG